MTENLLQKIEEKMMTLLSEVESLRGEVLNLKRENASLKTDREKWEDRLRGLVSLLDSVNAIDTMMPHQAAAVNKPVLVQG